MDHNKSRDETSELRLFARTAAVPSSSQGITGKTVARRTRSTLAWSDSTDPEFKSQIAATLGPPSTPKSLYCTT